MTDEPKLLPQVPVLTEYATVKNELQTRLDKLNAITVLTKENEKEVKTAIAEINKVKDRIARYRIDETNKFLGYINPYIEKCKELEKMCADGVVQVKAKVTALEEEERNGKISSLKLMFEDETKYCKYGEVLQFEMFYEKQMSNKTTSLMVVNRQLKEWVAKRTEDLNFINSSCDEPSAVIQIYLRNGLNLTQAITEYQDRFKSEAEIKGIIAQEQQKEQTFEKKLDIVVTIKQLPKSKVQALQSFLEGLQVEWEVKQA